MKFLKRLGFVLLGLFISAVAVAVLGGWALPTDYRVERSIIINRPSTKVFPLIASPERWRDWSPMNRRDPDMRMQYFGPSDAASGPGWTWQSNSEGAGKVVLMEVEANRRVAYTMEVWGRGGGNTRGELLLEPVGEDTQAAWIIKGDLGNNPLKHWLGLTLDEKLGREMDEGLAYLKAAVDKK